MSRPDQHDPSPNLPGSRSAGLPTPGTPSSQDKVDSEDLGRLLDQHATALTLFAAQWTTEPDDCVQEAFIELARQNNSPSDPVAWLYRVTKNRALNATRATQRRSRRENEHEAERNNWFQDRAEASFHQQPDGKSDETIDGELVTRALQELPDRQREVIVARLWGSLTFQQIAELTESSTSSVHRHWLAGLSTLRERLNPSCHPINETAKNPAAKGATRPTISRD